MNEKKNIGQILWAKSQGYPTDMDNDRENK